MKPSIEHYNLKNFKGPSCFYDYSTHKEVRFLQQDIFSLILASTYQGKGFRTLIYLKQRFSEHFVQHKSKLTNKLD